MSIKGFIPIICVFSIFLAPLLNQPNKSVLTKDSKGVIRDTGTVIKVLDKNKSNSGFVYCKYMIVETQNQYVGPCDTTDGNMLKVGWTYTSNKFNLGTDSKITLYQATKVSSDVTLEVTEIKMVARTRIAILANGNVISGDNVNVGDRVSVR